MKIVHALRALPLVCATAASAAVIYTESYEAPDFSIGFLNGQNGWIGEVDMSPYSSNYAEVESGGLSYAPLSIDGGDQAVRATAQNNNSNHTQGKISFAAQTGEIWMSVLFHKPVTPSEMGILFTFGDSAVTGSSAHPSYTLGVRVDGQGNRIQPILNSDSGASYTQSSFTYSEGETHLLLFRITKSALGGGDYDTVDAWLDPVADTFDAVTGQVRVSGVYQGSSWYSGPTSINTLYVTGYNYASSTPGYILWDHVQVAESLADIAPALVAIPEPSAWASLAGAAALAGTVARRRRHARS